MDAYIYRTAPHFKSSSLSPIDGSGADALMLSIVRPNIGGSVY